MGYKIKEIFYTLQGEGGQAGRAAVFCRFTGCNLWTGREKDRVKAICQFCDTDFVGTNGLNGGKYKTAKDVAAKVLDVWGAPSRYSRDAQHAGDSQKCERQAARTRRIAHSTTHIDLRYVSIGHDGAGT